MGNDHFRNPLGDKCSHGHVHVYINTGKDLLRYALAAHLC